MAYNDKIVLKVFSDFEKKEKAAVLAAERRRTELYKKLPELRDTDAMLADSHKEIIDSIINPAGDIKIKLEDIKNRNKNLQKQRKLILEANNYAENYTEPIYECRNCGDTGYKNKNMCGCLKRALAIESAKASGFGDIIKKQNFKNFSLDYYSRIIPEESAETENKAENKTESDYEKMRTVLESCKNYAEKFGQPDYAKHLIMCGKTGLGKTHLSSAIAGEVIKKGGDVYYGSAQSILYSFEKERFARYGAFNAEIIERYMTCDLLIIDDLGTEYSGNMTMASLYTLINMRIAESKNMIISTNLSVDDIRIKYDERIVSRIFGEFSVLQFVGEDIRFKK